MKYASSVTKCVFVDACAGAWMGEFVGGLLRLPRCSCLIFCGSTPSQIWVLPELTLVNFFKDSLFLLLFCSVSPVYHPTNGGANWDHQENQKPIESSVSGLLFGTETKKTSGIPGYTAFVLPT